MTAARTMHPLARQTDLTELAVDSELIIFDRRAKHYHALNHAAAAIWRLCDGARDHAEIAALASVDLNGHVSVDMVQDATAELATRGLLASGGQAVGPRTIDRRRVVAGVVLAGAAALATVPKITSIPAGSMFDALAYN